MSTVTFSNGKTANFDGTPTPADIDYVAQQMGIQPDSSSTPAQSSGGGFLDAAKAIGTGALNVIDNNPISKGLTSLAAIPVQLAAKVVGAPDPFAGGVGAGNNLGLAPAQVTSSDQPLGKYAAQEAGNAAVVGSSFIPVGDVGAAAGEGLARFAPQALKGAAGAVGRIGGAAAVGAGQGAAGALQDGQTAPSDIASAAVTGAGINGGLGAAGELGGAIVDNFASNTGESRLAAQTNNLKTLTKAFNDTSTKTTNPIQTMDENNLIKDLRVVDGKVNIEGVTNPQQTGSLDNMIHDQQTMGTQAVQQMKGGVPLDDFKKIALQQVKDTPAIVASGKVAKTVAEVSRRFDDYQESYGNAVPYSAVNSIRISMNKNWDPETWDAEKSIGNTARAILYNGTGAGTTLKSAMQNEQELINAKEFIQKFGGTAVRGGRLGKYLADMVGAGTGAAIGSSFGPFGTGAGMAAGGFLADQTANAYQKSYFDPLLTGPAKAVQAAASSPLASSAGNIGRASLIPTAVKK